MIRCFNLRDVEKNNIPTNLKPEKREKEIFLQKKFLFLSEKPRGRGFSERKQKFFCKKFLFSLFSGFMKMGYFIVLAFLTHIYVPMC